MKTISTQLGIRLSFATLALTALAAIAPAQSVEQRLALLESKVTTLESKVSNLQNDKWALVNDLANANSKIWQLEQKTKFMSVSGNTTRFIGTNLQIMKDSGNSLTPNGLGNLLVGYNALRTDGKPTPRTGSHNIVLGNENAYASSMGFVGGYRNSIDRLFSTILTGRDGIISTADVYPAFNAIITGKDQRIRGHFSTLLTGVHNVVDADFCGILAGDDNKIDSGENSLILSGHQNRSYGFLNVLISGSNSAVYGSGNVIGSGINSKLGHPFDANQWYRFLAE
ncbi:MAG: hypothetical protein ACOYON_10950 [Fimbriimonas sp.]